jgi:hypothetical protein
MKYAAVSIEAGNRASGGALDRDPYGRTLGERLDGGHEARLGQDRRMDPRASSLSSWIAAFRSVANSRSDAAMDGS